MKSPDIIKAASLITAIKTPYLENGDIDLATFDALVETQINGGVDGIVVGGTTGEGHLMSKPELLMLITHAVKRFAGRLLIIGNTGSNNTREAVKTTRAGFDAGMDAALQINPYYGKASMAGVNVHFEKLLDIGPAIIYNVPGRTGQDLPPSFIESLSGHAHFIGMKECAGNERIADYEKQGIACWSGNDDECHDARHLYGAHGVISVASNLVPALFRRLMDDRDDKLNNQLQPLLQWLFCEPNPVAINTALAMSGAVKPVFRLPYVPLNEQQQAAGITLVDILPAGGDDVKLCMLDETKVILI